MDVTCVDEVLLCADPRRWRPGDSWLAGGTVTYSYGTDVTRGAPRRLLDITEAGWPPIEWEPDPEGGAALVLSAACRIADLYALPDRPDLPIERAELPGLDMVRPSCDSFVASWKIWHVSTIGGNVATALPAGPMTSLLSGWDAVALVLRPDGGSYTLPVSELVLGPTRTMLGDGDLIRSFRISVETLRQPCAFRRISLTERGRSAALLIGRRTGPDTVRLAVTASTFHPVIVDLHTPGTEPEGGIPADADDWREAIDGIVAEGSGWYDDIHGAPAWRRLMTHRLGDEILAELLPDTATGVDAARGRRTGDIRTDQYPTNQDGARERHDDRSVS